MLPGKPCISTTGTPLPGTTSARSRYRPRATGSFWLASFIIVLLRPRGWPRSQGCGAGEFAAVDGDRCPADERCLVRTQPDGGGRDFIGPAQTVQRQVAADALPGRIIGPGEVVGQNRPGGDRVDPDSLFAVVERGGLGQ